MTDSTCPSGFRKMSTYYATCGYGAGLMMMSPTMTKEKRDRLANAVGERPQSEYLGDFCFSEDFLEKIPSYHPNKDEKFKVWGHIYCE